MKLKLKNEYLPKEQKKKVEIVNNFEKFMIDSSKIGMGDKKNRKKIEKILSNFFGENCVDSYQDPTEEYIYKKFKIEETKYIKKIPKKIGIVNINFIIKFNM